MDFSGHVFGMLKMWRFWFCVTFIAFGQMVQKFWLCDVFEVPGVGVKANAKPCGANTLVFKKNEKNREKKI